MVGEARYSGRYVLLGASGHARSIADALTSIGAEVLMVAGNPGAFVWPVPQTDDDTDAIEYARSQGAEVLVAIGSNRTRHELNTQLDAAVKAAPVTAASASVSHDASLGLGTVILHQAHVGPATRLGEGVVVNSGAVVEHDCTIGAGAHIAPGATVLGSVTIGEEALIGANACVLPGINIGDRAIVGAGSVVTTDIPADVIFVGTPAQQIGSTHD